MSETEEPPAKLIKITNKETEVSIPNVEDTLAEISAVVTGRDTSAELQSQTDDMPEDGHEEWLSEGILTDDDYIPNAENTQQSEDSQTSENINTAIGTEPKQAIPNSYAAALSAKTVDQNIEETLNKMDGRNKDGILEDELDAFLEKNNTESNAYKKNNTGDKKQEKDDGNDTDDLLRMLGEDDSKTPVKKKLTKTVKDLRSSSKNHVASSDEEDEYEGSTAKKGKAVKSPVSKKTPRKATPEDIGDGDDDATELSSDEEKKKETPKKKVFKATKPNILTKKLPPAQNLVVVKKPSESKQMINVVQKPGKAANAKPVATKQVKSKTPARSILKTSNPAKVVTSTPKPVQAQSTKEPVTKKLTFQPMPEKSSPAPKSKSLLKSTIAKPKEKPVEDEPMEVEELDSDFEELLSDVNNREMKTEEDEDALRDDDSPSDDDGTIYDEVPSSDSEDTDDWFQLDIRGEKASEYIPLLGSKALEALQEEKRRVAERITNLRQSLSALTESGKRQAESLRTATMSLAEIDDLLKCT